MKKRLLSLLLTASLLLSMLPVSVLAAREGLTVVIDNVHVVQENRAVGAMPAGVDYNESTKTLTLENAALGMIRISGGSLTIVLQGDSTIHNDGRYVDVTGKPAPAIATGDMNERTSVTITGPGSLTLDSSGSGARRTFVADYTDLTITDGADVTVRSGDAVGGVAEMVASRLILNDGASLTGKELFVSEDGTFLLDGATLDMSGADYALHLWEGGQATFLDGTATLRGTSATLVPVRCEPDGVLALLGGTIHLEKPGAATVLKAVGNATVLVGDGMSAVDNVTGKAIPIHDSFLQQIPGSSVTISGAASLGMYACDLDVTSGPVVQGVRFTVRAVVSRGAEQGQVSFTLPDGVTYVPGSLTVDSRTVEPTGTKPLTVNLERYGVIRFSAVSSRTGSMTLHADTNAGGTRHRESLQLAVESFRFSLPTKTSQPKISVSGFAVPGSTIAFYEGSSSLGRATANTLGTWSGTVTLPDSAGEHLVYAKVTQPDGGSFSTEEQSVYYDPEADVVTTLTVSNDVHGPTSADPPVEETLVIDYLTGQDSADYYTFWPDLPTLRFQVEFEKDASAQGSVTVVTTDQMGRETRTPLRYQAARDAWVGSHDFTEDTVPYRFRVEYSARGQNDLQSSATYTYDDQGRVSAVSYSSGTVFHVTYTGENQAKLTMDGLLETYDIEAELLPADAASDLVASEAVQDALGRVTELKLPDGSSYRFSYGSGQTLIPGMAEMPETVTYSDTDGTVFRISPASSGGFRMDVTRSDGQTMAYLTDSAGRITGVVDAAGNTTGYTLDSQGNITSIRYPDGQTETYAYDSAGRIVRHTSRSGSTVSYTYDGRGNITRMVSGNGDAIAYTYDGNGNVTSISDNGSVTTLSYADKDTLDRITYPDGRYVAYTYDTQGRMIRREGSDGYVTGYTYDSNDQLTSITDGKDTLIRYTYNSDGLLTRQDNANGSCSRYAYDGDQLTAITHYDAAGSVLSSYTYTYDSIGNVIAMTDPSGRWQYAYDTAGQLIRATAPDGTVTTYAYDAAGNRMQTTVNGTATGYTSNQLNQYTAYGDTRRVYDADGRLLRETRDGKTAYYTWDAWGRLTGYTDFDGTVYTYAYDAFGLRSRVTVDGKATTYLNDPTGDGYALAAYSDGEVTQFLLSGANAALRSGGETYYYHTNHLGSVTELTGSGGQAVNRYTYDQEGNVLTREEGVFNPYTYAGLFGVAADGNGLLYDRARYISTATDSFISMDPAGQAYDLNLYRYVYNNPVMFLDITGELGIGGILGGFFGSLGGNDRYHPYQPPKDDGNNGGGGGGGGNDKDGKKEGLHPPAPEGCGKKIDYLADTAPSDEMLNLLADTAKFIAWGVVIGCVIALLPGEALVGAVAGAVAVVVRGVGFAIRVAPVVFAVAGPAMAATPDRPKPVIWDPSGYVYEGIESNRLSDVTTTLYYSSGSSKPTGNASESQRWDAAAFDQRNPLTTDALGQYLWMVPDGWWQVKYEKAGYDTVYSEWLPVPPVQTEVNVGLTSKAAAKLTVSGAAGDSAVTLRFDRPVQIFSVTAETVQVSQSGAALSGTLTPVDVGAAADGQLCATTFSLRLSGKALGTGKLSASYEKVYTYAGTASTGTASAEVSRGLPFTDVGKAAYYYDSVSWAVNHEPQITAGTGGTFFSPGKACTRAQAVTFLWRAMGQPEPTRTTNPFTDVRATDYYYKAVLWAVEQGITDGTTATTFSPTKPCTRAQIVTFLHRMEKEQLAGTTANPFRDVASGAYYYNAVLWAVEWGITTGTSATAFSPNKPCTRAQIVTFLYRDMA